MNGEDERGLVKFPYLSSVHDGVNRVEKDGEESTSLWKVRMTEDW